MSTQTFQPDADLAPVAEPTFDSPGSTGEHSGLDNGTERTSATRAGIAGAEKVQPRHGLGGAVEGKGPGLGRDFSGVPAGGARAGAGTATGTAKKATKKGSDRGGVLQTIGSFFSSLVSHPGDAISHLFGGESFTQTQLASYLDGLKQRNDIEGDFDSDNKARVVVKKWKSATAGFNITGGQKALLIDEMLGGVTTGDDEQAILDLLTRSENGDLRLIFEAVPVSKLLNSVDGANNKKLRAWLETRFDGGLKAVQKDRVEPVGGLPANAPLFPYDFARLRIKLEGPDPVAEIIEELARRTPAERERAARDLTSARDAISAKVDELGDKAGKAPDHAARDAIQAELDTVQTNLFRMDLVMEDAFKDIVLRESPSELKSKAITLTPAQKLAARDALKPSAGGPPGAPVAFKSKLGPGQPTYEEKLRAASPGMIDAYWQQMAKDRQPSDHSDPAKMHTLQEMEDLAKVSKDETDDVFDGYYDKAAHLPMKADKPGKRRSLHDLWADQQAFLTDTSTTFDDKKAMAKALVFYFFINDEGVVAPLNREHHASPSFKSGVAHNDEAKAQERVARDMTKTAPQVRKLNEIDRGWDGSANPPTKEVNIQLFRPKGGVAKDQDFMWDMFQTLIHEYIHTLAAGKYRRFANSFDEKSPQRSVLIEGIDSFLDEVVWANIRPRVTDLGLRQKVEGPAYAALPPITVEPAYRRRYQSFTEATRLVTTVGFRNVILAYFKGEIERIGG
jgi:hypothetical protein